MAQRAGGTGHYRDLIAADSDPSDDEARAVRAAAEETSMYSQTAQELRMAMGRLETVMNHLAYRLEPVLLPAEPTPGTEGYAEELTSSVVQDVRNRRDEANTLADMVEGLVRRLTI